MFSPITSHSIAILPTAIHLKVAVLGSRVRIGIVDESVVHRNELRETVAGQDYMGYCTGRREGV